MSRMIPALNACSTAQVGHHDTPISTGTLVRGLNGGDVFVGEPMKAVALHAESRHIARQSKGLGNGWLPVVKGGIKTGDLWDILSARITSVMVSFSVSVGIMPCDGVQILDHTVTGKRSFHHNRKDVDTPRISSCRGREMDSVTRL